MTSTRSRLPFVVIGAQLLLPNNAEAEFLAQRFQSGLVAVIHIERSTDYGLIKAVMRTARDLSPYFRRRLPAGGRIPAHRIGRHLVSRGSGTATLLLGLWMLVPQNGICWEIHTCAASARLGRAGAPRGAGDARLGLGKHALPQVDYQRAGR